MDDLTALRELEADVPALTTDARAAGRARLADAMEREGRRTGLLSRRLVLRTSFTALAAAAAGTVVVAKGGPDGATGGRDGRGGRTGGSMLSAAQVLHRAADRTRADGAGTKAPRDDQYLYAMEVYTRTPLKSGKQTTHMDEFWISVDGSRLSRYVYSGRVKDEPPDAHSVQWPPTEYAKLAKLPTDPKVLLRELGHGGLSTELDVQSAYMDLVMLMRGPRVMPPGLQAAAFDALAELPGIVLEDDEVDALGRHGIGVSHRRASFGPVFERDTYAYLGLRMEGVKGARSAGKELTGGEKYIEVRALVKSGVVDGLGQRPR
ncbi:CU044_5270 family protein [Streptomyces sp. NBC_01012]|uniref:CU044_5270 family protein n=1 Tax=Streptomyces sp. NBC_01012 TaxID=2903717 RepID=UPI003870A125|nr:CU044_5270 family protein [Streptomyces sp. NBC_01012]